MGMKGRDRIKRDYEKRKDKILVSGYRERQETTLRFGAFIMEK